LGLDRTLVARDGIVVLLRPREAILGRTLIAAGAHMQIVVHVPQPVADQRIHQRAVSEPVASARLVQQERHTRHVLRAARDDDIGIAALNGLRRQHHRFQATAADLVDGGRTDVDVESRADRRLPGDVLTETGTYNVAENDFIDLGMWHLGPLQRCFDDRASECRRGHFRIRPRKRADGSPCATRQIDVLHHDFLLPYLVRAVPGVVRAILANTAASANARNWGSVDEEPRSGER
jgi:hypothetical protein